jgi:hypothetical protein
MNGMLDSLTSLIVIATHCHWTLIYRTECMLPLLSHAYCLKSWHNVCKQGASVIIDVNSTKVSPFVQCIIYNFHNDKKLYNMILRKCSQWLRYQSWTVCYYATCTGHRLYNYIDNNALSSISSKKERTADGYSRILCAFLPVLPILGGTFRPVRRKNLELRKK